MASSAGKPGQLEVPSATPSAERPKLTTTTTRTTTHRLPPPALFQGPPSKNASHISLVLPTDRPPAEAEGSAQHGQRKIIRPSRVPPASSFSGTSPSQLRRPTAGTDEDDQRAEQLWAEMQRTLADVEISAMNTSHVFGSSHLRALEELRTAQLSLAQTWAKIEADESLDHDFDIVSQKESNLSATLDSKTSATAATQRPKGTGPGTGTTASPATGKDGASPDGKPSAFTNDKNLEEETERDLQLARKRREANDRYFSQVNKGVLDVVSKLDEVAGAMRRVERESREIWDESSEDSDDANETGGSDTEGEATDRTGMTDSPVPVRKDG
ncbi:hypothetical protein AYO21_07108 [Fonsecaea monophora]|uniref:Uncharacterized protein n=2 Tax=Fonsecaea TaxID=40354 RepID=A0A178D1N3_9EURO|nr:hypothetical protein AYO20_05186 [Fonsecaea nubica]XP_022510554.1 hypothetical protein AYO21_07108 [Fonsecaea monophora]KAH0846457.1 hypothetical protein FOPE_12180 [Fonsecaea pedrosoi]OAG38602.1 hypothetical protein AYO21_07108 [Fonsecaea monophora]OAL35567.1 hypothetical protein AYO20_05186 [Fonsecaea nubica]